MVKSNVDVILVTLFYGIINTPRKAAISSIAQILLALYCSWVQDYCVVHNNLVPTSEERRSCEMHFSLLVSVAITTF